jgi:hypothetical protein
MKLRKLIFIFPQPQCCSSAYWNKYLIRKYKPTTAASSRYIKSQGGQLLYQGFFSSMPNPLLFSKQSQTGGHPFCLILLFQAKQQNKKNVALFVLM